MNSEYEVVSRRSGPDGSVTVTTFNLYNLFDYPAQENWLEEWGDPAVVLEVKLAKLTLAVHFELRLPDILLVQEVESARLLQQLGDRINDAAGSDYQAVSFKSSDRRGIQVGFLWDRRRVSLLEAYPLTGPDVETAFGERSPNPGREPLIGRFQLPGCQLTVVCNHFKSNYVPEEMAGFRTDVERSNRLQRQAQARVVRRFADELLAADPAALLLVGGDFNESESDPVAGTLPILQGQAGPSALTDLWSVKGDPQSYTYISGEEPKILDYMLVSPALLRQLVGVDVLHFNAAASPDLAQDPTTAHRVSDHDPVEARFSISGV